MRNQTMNEFLQNLVRKNEIASRYQDVAEYRLFCKYCFFTNRKHSDPESLRQFIRLGKDKANIIARMKIIANSLYGATMMPFIPEEQGK